MIHKEACFAGACIGECLSALLSACKSVWLSRVCDGQACASQWVLCKCAVLGMRCLCDHVLYHLCVAV